jgi:L-fuconolactonase
VIPQLPNEEEPLDAARSIIDPHLHLWEIHATDSGMQNAQRFLFHDALKMIGASGHNVTHTVYVECHAMYRADGAAEFRPIGETEFANGAAAMSASGNYGACRIAHRIVGTTNLLLGAGVRPALEAHQRTAGERFRGIRFGTAFSQAGMFGAECNPSLRGIMRTDKFRHGARVLAQMELTLDVWCFHTQLDDLIDLAGALPDLMIILDHVGTPECLGAFAGHESETRAEWAKLIGELARRPNVRIKLGGLGMNLSKPIGSPGSASSTTLAAKWRPYIESCIEAFTPRRAMFESNFPPDNASGSYGATWNAFKIIASDYSNDEKNRLFHGTAAETYRIALDKA